MEIIKIHPVKVKAAGQAHMFNVHLYGNSNKLTIFIGDLGTSQRDLKELFEPLRSELLADWAWALLPVDETQGKNVVVQPLKVQARLLFNFLRTIRNSYQEIVVISHGMGAIAAVGGVLRLICQEGGLKDNIKVVLLSPPDNKHAADFLENRQSEWVYFDYQGNKVRGKGNPNGLTGFPQIDGTFSWLPAVFFKEIKTLQLVQDALIVASSCHLTAIFPSLDPIAKGAYNSFAAEGAGERMLHLVATNYNFANNPAALFDTVESVLEL